MSTTDLSKKIQRHFKGTSKRESELRQFMEQNGFSKNDPYIDPEKGTIVDDSFRFHDMLKLLETVCNTLLWVQKEVDPRVSMV